MLEEELFGSYQMYLVIISVLVAALATYASISLAARVKSNSKEDKWILFIASFVLGGGIWTMHFIGMEAFHLGIPVDYATPLVFLSFLWPVSVSYLSFWIIWKHGKRKYIQYLSGIILGLGIAGMHYTGMKSMIMAAEINYHPVLFVISIAVSIIVSIIGVHYIEVFLKGSLLKKLGGAIFFGLSISTVHYIGMSAARFTIHNGGLHNDMHNGSHSILSFSLSLFVLFIFVIILITSLMEEQYTSKLRESEEQYRRIVESAPIGIAVHQYGTITYINPTGIETLGAQSMEEIVGRNVLDFIHPEFHDLVRERWQTIRDQDQPVDVLEEKMVQINNTIINVEMKAIPYRSDGKRAVQIFFHDITARKKAEKMIYHMAFHDPLTELPNRRLFIDKLNHALEEIRTSNKRLAVMFIDLDEFKKVNDTLGHDVGDELLITVAKSLSHCVRGRGIVSRFAGDEFAIMLPEVDQKEAEKLANNIIEGLEIPIAIRENNISVTPSIGISISVNGEETAEELIKQADKAMYQAKKQGKNTYYFY